MLLKQILAIIMISMITTVDLGNPNTTTLPDFNQSPVVLLNNTETEQGNETQNSSKQKKSRGNYSK
jgi:hypothetical protein